MRSVSTLVILAGLSIFTDAYGPPPPAYGPRCPDGKCLKSATPYCSSYLKIPEKTITVKKTITAYKTTTTKTVFEQPKTYTVKTDSTTTTYSVITEAPRCTAPSFLPSLPDVGDVLPDLDLRPLVKPQYGYPPPQRPRTQPKPICFKDYQKNEQITSACKCANIKPSTKTVTKTTTSTPVVVTKKTITTGETKTVYKVTSVSTKVIKTTTFVGPIAIPTKFNIVASNPGSVPSQNNLPPTIQDGFRGTLAITNVNTRPLNFLLPISDGSLPLGDIFTLNSAGHLLSSTNDQAGLSAALGDDPLQISFPTGIFEGEITAKNRRRQILPIEPALLPLTCSIQADEMTRHCRLLCTGGPVPEEGMPGVTPAPFSTQLVCGVDNSYNVGSFTGGLANSDDATCVDFTPLVVDVESILPGRGDEIIPGIEIL